MVSRARRCVFAVLASSAAAALVMAACSDPYAGEAPTSPPAEAGPDGSFDGGAATDPCLHRAPPGRPDRDDAPGVALPTFVLALDPTVPPVANAVGFDLDGVCTCETRPGTARDGGESCVKATGTSRCDGPDGVDNALAAAVELFSSFYPFADVLSQQVGGGRGNLLIQIAGYNGLANDGDVTVGLLRSEGIRSKACPTSAYDSRLDVYKPGLCGDDPWSISPSSVVGVSTTAAVAGRGYVRDYTLVVRVLGTPHMPFNEAYSLPFEDAQIVAKLVPLGEDLKPRDPARAPVGREGRLWRLEQAELSGRVAVRELLTAMGTLRVESDGGPSRQLCNESAFGSLKGYLCQAPDLARTQSLDFTDAPCDALSSSLPFTAGPAVTGPILARPRPVGPCDPTTDGQTLDAGAKYVCP